MGSPRTEAERAGGPENPTERQHRRRIGRTFALASKEVTVAQFRDFRPDMIYEKKYSPTDDHPINNVTWYEAAAYCNWLSAEEGIPEDQWCYEAHRRSGFAAGMRTRPDFLNKTGYRLPTEAEWEYACRAGAVTGRYYGEAEGLLGEYAWYAGNSREEAALAGGSLKPNDFGLFDMLGNELEWCGDPAYYYPLITRARSIEDYKYLEYIMDLPVRVLRGGAFTHLPGSVRCAYRREMGPMGHYGNVGFRPARTCR
jgi:formylglycine-generating enzyme required for sulfatase activity